MKLRYLPLAVMTAVACRTPDPALSVPMQLIGPIAVGGSLVYVDQGSARAVSLNLATPVGTLRTLAVGSHPLTVTARNGAPEALVLSQGVRDDVGVTPQPGTLTAVDASGAVSPNDRTYAIGSPFTGLAQTDDGHYAFAYFTPGARAQRLLFNPNEVALVDLTQPPGASNPTLRTVRSFGGIPTGVFFSPPLTLGMTPPRTLAVVLSPTYVTLLDISHPDRPEITVQLTLPGDSSQVDPSQVLFDPTGATVYVRGDLSNDIYALHLATVTPASPTDNDFVPAVNQLGAGQSPHDMALFTDGGRALLLVASPGSSEALVVDALSSTVTSIPLDAPADQIVLWTGPSPTNPTPHPQALLYDAEGQTDTVTFLELPGLSTQLSQNAESVSLGSRILAALPILDQNVVMFQHPTDASEADLSVLDLGLRTASPIVASVPLEGASFDTGGAALWVAPALSLRVGYIDLGTLAVGEIRLDQPVTSVVPLTGDTPGLDRVVAIHPGEGGDITVIDARNPSRSTAISYQGFLFSGLLDR